MKIILLSGKSASGKDTLATAMRKILENKNYKCITLHFADLVKFYAEKYYNWDGVKDEYGRTIIQQLGTNKVRALFPNYWAEAISKFLAVVANDFDYALVPDARFENEIDTIKLYNTNVYTIRIERFNQDKTPYYNPAFTQEQLNHPSETSLDDYEDFDYTVENYDSDVLMLDDAANTILADIK